MCRFHFSAGFNALEDRENIRCFELCDGLGAQVGECEGLESLFLLLVGSRAQIPLLHFQPLECQCLEEAVLPP
jgi:hypothetical protein